MKGNYKKIRNLKSNNANTHWNLIHPYHHKEIPTELRHLFQHFKEMASVEESVDCECIHPSEEFILARRELDIKITEKEILSCVKNLCKKEPNNIVNDDCI